MSVKFSRPSKRCLVFCNPAPNDTLILWLYVPTRIPDAPRRRKVRSTSFPATAYGYCRKLRSLPCASFQIRSPLASDLFLLSSGLRIVRDGVEHLGIIGINKQAMALRVWCHCLFLLAGQWVTQESYTVCQGRRGSPC